MKISVITATWNCAGTVGDCLASVAGQSYAAREHILIDGGSRDGTLEVLHAHRAGLAVLVSEPDGGIYDALNKGLARATGEVVGFLHADDVYADGEVLARVAAAFADPAVDAVYGDLVYVRKADTGRVVYVPQVLVRMRVGGESNRSLSRILRKSREDYRALRENGIGGAGALVWKNLSKIPQFFRRG